MAQYTLVGAGTHGLSSGVVQLDVEVLVTPTTATVGHASPPNYYHVGLLRLGDQGYYYPAIPIDAIQQELLVPAGVTTLGYSLEGTASIQVTERLAPPVQNYQKQPWDRNPLIVAGMYLANVAGGTNTATVWTYTVPAARLLRLATLRVRMKRVSAATSVSSSSGNITIGGYTWASAIMFSNIVNDTAADDIEGGPIDLPTGTVLTGSSGNLDNGGIVLIEVAYGGYTFDA